MDYSIRSLNSKKNKDKRGQAQKDDRSALIIRNAHRIFQNKGNKPIEINDLLNLVNKLDVNTVSRDEFVELLRYYQSLNVVHINSDDQVMWL